MLLIDDNTAVREAVRALLLAEPGLRVVGEAADGPDGLDRAGELRPDLIVLDQEMPGPSGLDVLPTLRRMLPDCRIVFFTLSVEIEAQALAGGAVAVVAKEQPQVLLTTLRRLAEDRARLGLVARVLDRRGQPRR